MGGLSLAFLAGLLSILSPCVVPLLPIMLGTASSEHRHGPLALAAGLALSFTLIGLFVATLGFSLGIDQEAFRTVSAVLLIAFGGALAVPAIQTRVAVAGGPLANWAEQRFGDFSSGGLKGQFGVGLLLGAVWSPCVGPTLGAASLLAAQRKDLPHVALTMLTFGIGSAVPLILLGMLSRTALLGSRRRLLNAGRLAKTLFGLLLAAVGLLILTGADRSLETALVDLSPQWLTVLSTRF